MDHSCGKTLHMGYIAQYIFKKFIGASFGLVALLAFLGWMIQLLRSIDLVTAKGQGLITMLHQSALVVPEVINIILFICVALGVSRSLTGLQQSREIYPIHSAHGPAPLIRALLAFIVLSVTLDVALNNYIVTLANQTAAKQSDEFNADLIANSSRPGKFTEVAPKLTLMIEERDRDGTGKGFFLYDKRDPERSQTIIAQRSQISKKDERLFIHLQNGAVQYYTYATGQLSTLEFHTYQVAVRELSGTNLFAAVDPTTPEILALMSANKASPRLLAQLHIRSASMFYVICLAILAFSLTMAPRSGRKKPIVSVDVVILGAGVTMKVLGTATQQSIISGGADPAILYIIPLIPLLPAFIALWHHGAFSRLPAGLRRTI